MGHEEATKLMAAERYLLGELSGAERDQFEEHFFECRACAEDVRAGAIFKANARAVFADQPRHETVQPGWWEWLRLRPAFAGALAGVMVVLAGGFGYQAVTAIGLRREIAELRAPQSFPSVFLRSATRGAGQVVEVPRESRFVGLSLDLTPGQSSQQYLGEVLNESGAILFTVRLSKPGTPGEPLNVLVPVSSLELGRSYTLVVRGLGEGSTDKRGVEVGRYNFTTTQRN